MPKKSPIDPTANVIELVRGEVKRLDDLRELEAKHVREVMELHATYARELNEKESRRLDAIRQVDQINSSAAAAALRAAVDTLAATNATERETLRTLVATTATAQASSQGSIDAGIQQRLAALEKSSYEGKGRGGGMSQLYVWALGAIAAVSTIYALFVSLSGKR